MGGAAGIENAAIPIKHLDTDDGHRKWRGIDPKKLRLKYFF
jgi:hypothetical protein